MLVTFIGELSQFSPQIAVPVDRHVPMSTFPHFTVVAEVSFIIEAEPLMVTAVLGPLGKQIDESPRQVAS